MAAIRFYLKPLKSAQAHIMAAFQCGSDTPKTKYLGYSIPSNMAGKEYKFWDKKKKRVKGVPQADEINNKIIKWEKTFETYISECNLSSIAPDIPYIMSNLDGTIIGQKKENYPLIPIINQFLTSIKPTHAALTYNGYKVLLHDITDFQTFRKKEILLSHIDRTLYKEFANYLITEEKNTNATINRKQGKIITILNYATEDLKIKLPTNDYKKRYTVKETAAAKFPLRPEELATLRAHIPTNPYHRLVLDAFLLACETGLRHSDITQLRSTHIQSQVTPTGIIRFISLTNVKTDNPNSMPLSDHACKIIDRYTTSPSPSERAGERPLFKFHHSQVAGKVLKTIFQHPDVNLARPCEVITTQGSRTIRTQRPLHDIISFHMARNTYITRLLSSNLPPALVQHNAGHSKIDITMAYFRNDDITRWQETLKILNS